MHRTGFIAGLVIVSTAMVLAGVAVVFPPVVQTLGWSDTAVPATVNHQGVVLVNGVRHNGAGQFRFAVIDPTTGSNLWTNDGTQIGTTNAPTAAVSLTVSDGVYQVALGDTAITNMSAVNPTVFNNASTVLRVWFDNGQHGVQQLSPDQKLTSVPYAFAANTVADGSVTLAKLAEEVATVPSGTVVTTVRSTAPAGWLLCDGSAVSRDTYAGLFAAVGTTFGAGDGSTTFNLPDLRGRIAMGAGTGIGDRASGSGKPTGGSALTARSLGQWGGAQTHTLSTAEMPSHNHGTAAGWGSAQGGTSFYASLAGTAGCDHTTCPTGSAGSNSPHNNIQPFVVLNYIIKY